MKSALSFFLSVVSVLGQFKSGDGVSTEVRVLSLLPYGQMDFESGGEDRTIDLSASRFSEVIEASAPLNFRFSGGEHPSLKWTPDETEVEGLRALILYQPSTGSAPAIFTFSLPEVLPHAGMIALLNLTGVDLEGEVLGGFRTLRNESPPLTLKVQGRFSCDLHSTDHRYSCEFSGDTSGDGWRWLFVVSKPFISGSGVVLPRLVGIPPQESSSPGEDGTGEELSPSI